MTSPPRKLHCNNKLISPSIKPITCRKTPQTKNQNSISPIKSPSKYGLITSQAEITYKMREIVVDWMINTHNRFNLQIESLFLSVALLDSLLTHHSIPKKSLQLAALTSLIIASKKIDTSPPPIKTFLQIANESFSKAEIMEMQSHIISANNNELFHQSPIYFVQKYSSQIKLDNLGSMICQFCLELTLLNYKMRRFTLCQLAVASMCISLKTQDKWKGYSEILRACTECTEAQLKSCEKELTNLIYTAGRICQSAIWKKFSSQKYLEVSKLNFKL